MPHPDPTPFITAFNAWDQNDLNLPPAAVSETSVQGLPEAPGELIALLPEAHRTFMRDSCGPEYQTLTFGEDDDVILQPLEAGDDGPGDGLQGRATEMRNVVL
jgi:hypothetical protein